MKTSNWPGGVDYGHSNHTLRFPRVSRYDGVGGWAKDSSKIPARAWGWTVVFVAGFIGVLYLSAAVGF